MKALIISDCSDLCRLLTGAVEALDFTQTVMADPASAIREFEAHQHDLIVLSLRPGTGDVLELCKRFRELDPQQRANLLVVTDRSAPADLQILLDHGADDYLIDPVDPKLLAIRLQIAAQRVHRRAKATQLAKQLQESIERFELAVSGANDGLWDAQPSGRPWHDPNTVIWYSPRSKELLGFADDEFPNVLSSWESRLHPDDRERVFTALSDHIEHKRPYDVEYRLRTKSGEYRWFSARGHAIWDAQGALLRMAGSLRDITQLKDDAAKLAQSEARWRSLVENAPDIIILADLDGTIQFINRSTPRANDSIGHTTYEYIDEQHREAMRQAFNALRATGNAQKFEVHGQTESGQGMLWYANSLGPIWNDGQVESAVLIATDITHRKVAEIRLERERELLRRLLDLQERERQLVAYEIHDGLVQYLTGGLMHLEAAGISGDAATPQLKADYDRGMGLLRDALVEARRLISGLRPPILDEQGVVSALEYLINEARPDIPRIEFVNRFFFGRLAAPLEVAIFRITQEALSNIRQHSGAERARVELLQHGEWARLMIRDWGCGFDPRQVHEERFGLQGIRQRARLLGTVAMIDSAPDKGTTVVVDIPLVPKHPADSK